MLSLRLIFILPLQMPVLLAHLSGPIQKPDLFAFIFFFFFFIATCISGILGFCFISSISWQQAPPFGAKSASSMFVMQIVQAGR